MAALCRGGIGPVTNLQQATLGEQRIVLAGHSFGGYIVLPQLARTSARSIPAAASTLPPVTTVLQQCLVPRIGSRRHHTAKKSQR